VDMFDADGAEVQVEDGNDGQPILCASGAYMRRPQVELSTEDLNRWQEAALVADRTVIGALRVALRPGHSATAFERLLLRDSANHVSLLVRRMQLHEHERQIATELQRGLLP